MKKLEHIYILRTYSKNSSLLKFGYSNGIKGRIQSYKNANPFVEILYVLEVENAYNIEQEFHNTHDPYHSKEWYEENMLDKMLIFLKNKGITIPEETDKNYLFKRKVLKSNFKNTVTLSQQTDSNFSEQVKERYPFLHEAILLLGYEKIEQLDYNVTNIQRHLLNIKGLQATDLIREHLRLHPKITTGVWVSREELKNILKDVYNECKLTRTSKASDISLFFTVKETNKLQKGLDNKRVPGYTIIKT